MNDFNRTNTIGREIDTTTATARLIFLDPFKNSGASFFSITWWSTLTVIASALEYKSSLQTRVWRPEVSS